VPALRHGHDAQVGLWRHSVITAFGLAEWTNMTETEEMDKLSRLVAELQQQIDEEERATFSPRVLELARRPRNMGAMLDPDAYALLSGACGDLMQMFVRLDGPRIEMATFMTDGCGPTLACGSMLTTMVRGKTLDEAVAIRALDLVAVLGGLPQEHVHCASLAVNTLRLAIFRCQDEGQPAGVQ
jgi:nitrogen fixation NifU-like protein